MNRKERRDLRKDKNLITELFSIINKYFPNLLDKFSNLTDVRNKSYVTYNMKTICVTRLFGLLCGITSISSISDDLNTDATIKNISQICKTKLEELPYWETIQDVFENININELRQIQKYIVIALIRSKMFDKYRYDGNFILIFDGTGLSSHNYNLNGNCLSKKSKDGKITYYKYVLECKLSVGSMVISLDSEFIENAEMITEKQKQDCEINAFKRMAERIKKNYPKYKFIVVGDALYATTPIINICKKNKWYYIFNLKTERLKEVNSAFEGNIKFLNETSKPNYYLSTYIKFKGNILAVFKYEEKNREKFTTFRYISNLDVSDDNIVDIVRIGRQRWNIENNGFYIQKHRTFNISHLSSRNDNAMKCHYFFIQFAHTFRQLLEKGNLLVKSLKLKIKEVSANLLKSLTSTNPNLNNLEKNFQLRFDD